MKLHIAVLPALAAVLVLGGCQKPADKKGGTVKPAATSSTTATTAKATTSTTAKATTSTTAKAATTTTTAKAAATTTTTARPVTTTTAATVSYANCSAVKAAGKAPLHRGDPGYSSSLDRDGDGIACE